MQYWPLRVSNTDFRLNVDQTVSLLARVGERQGKMLAGDMLKLVSAKVP